MPSWSDAAAVAVVLLVACDGARFRDEPIAPLRVATESVSEDARPAVGLVPSADAGTTAALAEGARRALDEERAAGGADLELVVGTASSSSWESAASEAVRLACAERVVALIGPPERERAHPVAQAATRCGVLVVSTARAASVTAAGSRYVVSVAAAGDETAATPSRAELVAAGYDAAQVVVSAVRRAGLAREAVVAAVTDGTAVTGAAGPLRFGAFGRRDSASK